MQDFSFYLSPYRFRNIQVRRVWWQSANYGYGNAPTALSVTVTNTGYNPMDELTVTLSI
jgi:hypothetical protein